MIDEQWIIAESELVSCILIKPKETLNAVRSIIQSSDLCGEFAKAVFIAACELADENEPLDPVTIQNRAKKDGNPVSEEYLKDAMKLYVTDSHICRTAEIIRESAIEREARNIGLSLSEGEITANSAVESLQNIISGHRLSLPTPSEDGGRFYQQLSEASSGKKKLFTSTGFLELDEILGGGLIESGLITLAARPACGKTVLGLAIADNVAVTGKKVLYESLEMSREQLWSRRVARFSGISYSALQSGNIKQNDTEAWTSIAQATAQLSQRPLQISDANAKMDDIEFHARSIGDIGLLVIDHMGFITPDKGYDNMYATTTEISHRLKRLAKALKIPILSLCQLNRSSEGRPDRRPTLADLRNSGAIEEDSDAVILLYRPDMYLPKEEQKKPWEAQDIDITVAKNRHGRQGVVTFDFIGMTAQVRERRNQFSDYGGKTPFEKE